MLKEYEAKSDAERNLEVMGRKRVCVSVKRTHLRTPHTALDRNRPSVAEPEEQFGGRGAAAGGEEDRGQQRAAGHMKDREEETGGENRKRRLFPSGLIHCILSNNKKYYRREN